MRTSIAYTTVTQADAVRALAVARARTEQSELLDLLSAVRDALDIPAGHRRQALLDTRARLIHGVLRDVLDGRAILGIAGETELIRRMVCEDDGHA